MTMLRSILRIAVLAGLSVFGLLSAQAPREPRTALVIGAAAYRDAPLKNPVNDARAMAAALRSCGFEVTMLENPTREQLFPAIRTFGQKIQGGGVGLFYFAGHGMQVKGRNYLIPIGADIALEDEVASQALEVDAVLAKMESARNRLNILILDACRNNPFRSFRSLQQGLAQMDAPVGSFVAFATAPGRTAADGTGSNGVYTEALLRHLGTSGLRLEDVFKRTRAEVLRASGGAQVPWESSSLLGEFYFLPLSSTAAVPAPLPTPILAVPESAPARWTNSLGMEFIQIPAGSFMMGSPSSKGSKDEHPQHRVTFAKPFYLARVEVTRKQFTDLMGTGYDPKFPDVPAGMSWNEAAEFIHRLNAKDGNNVYRMPSEAEWEYACRAGTTSDWCSGDDKSLLKEYAWYHGLLFMTGLNSVGLKRPNAWGLQDVHGNATEWCADVWHENYVGAPEDGSAWLQGGDPKRRVQRGGNFMTNANICRSAYRDKSKADYRSWELGLRLVAIPKP